MEQVVDTVIIGGGPAGIASAIRLQKGGVSNLVLEKKVFPREKTCAGMMTEKTVKMLAKLLDLEVETLPKGIFCNVTDTVELYHGQTMLTRSTVAKPFRKVMRFDFDNFMATQYKNMGGNLLENTCCASLDLPGNKMTLSNGDTVVFRHLIVADGVLSNMRELLGYQKPKLGFCVETHVPKEKLPGCDVERIYFGIVPKGYTWVFPSGDKICIGLGGVYQKGTPYEQLLKDFLAALGIDAKECTLKGAFMPFGSPVKQNRGPDNAILIGDAGGFIDPITGEGLYFALVSGMAAADVILNDPQKIRPAFLKQIEPFARTIRQGNWLQGFFYSAVVQKMFVKMISGKNGFVRFYSDHQLSEYNYPYAQMMKLCRDYKKGKNRK